ncbi:hypothetical protein TNCV_4666871 [Trichonephila clavipes]|nr:hypothetical protein TNCV_4666871 [Trichonephila clavipes]
MGVLLWVSGLEKQSSIPYLVYFDVEDDESGVLRSAERHDGHWLRRRYSGCVPKHPLERVGGFFLSLFDSSNANYCIMSLEQVKLKIIWIVPKFDEAILSNPTPGSSIRPTCRFSLSTFHKPLLYNDLGQITAAHGSSIFTTELSQSAASFLEKLSPIPTLKTTCGNRGRRKNVAEGLFSSKKRVTKGGCKEGVWENAERERENSTCQQTKCILHLSCPWC